MTVTAAPARILFLVSAHNGLSRRAQAALTDLGHEVAVEVVADAAQMEAAVARHAPRLIACPMLKTVIPASVWSAHRCLVVHPGPPGDRGPSSLDWAIELGAASWGVTVLEATDEIDGGPVWASRSFRMRAAAKSSLYRHEVRRAAVEALVEAVGRVLAGEQPTIVDPHDPAVTGRARPAMTQRQRAIDWQHDDTAKVLRRIRAADSRPGVLDELGGSPFRLFGAHPEPELRGIPGQVIGRRDGAICRATTDGAVWITHLEAPGSIKLPATRALELAGHELTVPEVPLPVPAAARAPETWREISYEEDAGVGYLRFEFANGAMGTDQCRRLLAAVREARRSPRTRVLVLLGGRDCFSTGIHLNLIEAGEDPAAESWRNLLALNEVVREVVETESHLVVSALAGDAGAGGVPLALAADHVVAREHVVLNPFYRHMGGLHGSEYWTYLLPRRVGPEATARLTNPPFEPVGAPRAVALGLLDAAFGATAATFESLVRGVASQLARDPDLPRMLEAKRARRAADERRKPLHAYRTEELARTHRCFFGADPSYHEARRRFVRKLPPLAQPGAPAIAGRPALPRLDAARRALRAV
jgi:putative two-component system hydrogenase maturation factor HypX/HoxX